MQNDSIEFTTELTEEKEYVAKTEYGFNGGMNIGIKFVTQSLNSRLKQYLAICHTGIIDLILQSRLTMAHVLIDIFRKLKKFDEDTRDRRVDTLYFGGNPKMLLMLVASYCIFVKQLGPRLMKTRKPFELKNVLLAYNAIQVILNSWYVYEVLYALMVFQPYKDYGCIETFFTNDFYGKLELRFSNYYVILKFVDYLDTIFFVLRKRFKQISFLHFYHHVLLSLCSFVILRYQPAGHMMALGLVNSFVHSVMYSYYFISALRPELSKSIWWKKHITQLQIAQFLLLLVHFLRPLFRENCKYPKFLIYLSLTQAIVMSVLFIDFYIKNYIRRPSLSKEVHVCEKSD